MFSIELKSKDQLKRFYMPSLNCNDILIEGFIGKLESICCTEGVMLEMHGADGCLRMELTKQELDLLFFSGRKTS